MLVISGNIEDLIGKECFYHGCDEDGIETPPVLVKILGYYIEVDDKPPYELFVRFNIEPVGEHDMDEFELEHLKIGGSHSIFLTFDNHF